MKKIFSTVLAIIILTIALISNVNATGTTPISGLDELTKQISGLEELAKTKSSTIEDIIKSNAVSVTETKQENPTKVVDTAKDYSDKFIMQEVFEQTNTNAVIEGNMYIMSKSVKLSGTVNGSIYLLSQDINLSNLHVNGSIYLIGQNINIQNTVVNNVYTAAENVNLSKNNTVLANVYIGAQRIVIDPSTKIGRETYLSSQNDDGIPEQLKKANYHFYKVNEKTVEPTLTEKIASKTVSIISTIVVILVLATIILNVNKETKTRLQNIGFGKASLLALASLALFLIVPMIAFLLLITGIFAKLAIILIVLFLLLILLSHVYAIVWLASLVAKGGNKGNGFVILMALIFSIVLAIVEAIGIGVIPGILTLLGMGLILNLTFTKIQPEELTVQPAEIKTVETPVSTEVKAEEKVETKPEAKEEVVVFEEKAPEATETKTEENKD